MGNVPTYWSVSETGEFNGDGKGDILWRGGGGEAALWLMNGTQILSAIGLPNVGTYWTVQSRNAN